jgi:hypothetical protein
MNASPTGDGWHLRRGVSRALLKEAGLKAKDLARKRGQSHETGNPSSANFVGHAVAPDGVH